MENVFILVLLCLVLWILSIVFLYLYLRATKESRKKGFELLRFKKTATHFSKKDKLRSIELVNLREVVKRQHEVEKKRSELLVEVLNEKALNFTEAQLKKLIPCTNGRTKREE